MRILNTLGLVAAVGLATTAQANIVSTFGFTDLNAFYDGQAFHAMSMGALPTGGDVTDYTNGMPNDSATFESGFIGVQNLADVHFEMDIGNITGTTAEGTNGRIVIRDADNDVLSGTFEGVWDYRFGFGFFDGEITLASYNDAGNGIFEGTGNDGSFVTPDGSYIGAISFLVYMPEWFSVSTTIQGLNAEADGILVTPAPASLALLGLGGLAASRRRRA